MQNCTTQTEYKIQRLSELLALENGEEYFNVIAQAFKSKNKDVETFLKTKAVQATKLSTATTYLVYTEQSPLHIDLVGYFSLAAKMLSLKKSVLSAKESHSIKRFSYFDFETESYNLPAILIGQFSRNFSADSLSIRGTDLMAIVIEQVKTILSLLSGKIVFLEAENKQKVIDFYLSEHFRLLDNSVISRGKKELVQLYRLL